MIFEVIDMRSFSNLWFWLALALLWSATSHFVIGVPYDMVRRAARLDGDALSDTELLAHINARRLLRLARDGGTVLVAVTAFVLSGLTVLATVFAVELAQAVLCLLLPLLIVAVLSLRTCLVIEAQALTGTALLNCLRGHRLRVQAVGMVALFLTGLFGMYQNMTQGVLG